MKTWRTWLVLIMLTVAAGASLKAQPANDNFANAIPLGDTTLVGTDLNATLQPNEPAMSGVTDTVWWYWTAPASGLAWIDLDGSSGDYYVGIYTGPAVSFLSPVLEIASPSPAPLPGTFTAAADTKYYFQVSGYGGNDIVISIHPDAMLISDFGTSSNEDGSEPFSASVEVGNSGASQQTVKIDLVARAGFVYLTNSSPTNALPPDMMLTNYVTNLASGTNVTFPISGTCPFPYIISNENVGIQWSVFLDYKGTYTNSLFLFQGQQASVGAGAITNGPATNNPNAPFQPVSSVLNGSTTVLENSTNYYSGTVLITNGSTEETVNFSNSFWTVSPGSPFTIDSNGVFTVGLVLNETQVTLTAEYPLSGTNYFISTNVLVIIPNYPVIVVQPASQQVALGQQAEFTVAASGPGLSYQWSFNNEPVAGATTSALVIPAAQWSDNGTYSVLASNSVGVAVSTNVTLQVYETSAPTVAITRPGPNAAFNIIDSIITVSGTATDLAGVAQVLVKNNTNAVQIANGGSNWSATVTLSPGANFISVVSINLSGIQSPVVAQNVTLELPTFVDGLALLTNGYGTIQHAAWPKKGLVVGDSYTVTAAPKANNLFSNWVGGTTYPYSVLSTSAKYKFAMQTNLVLAANFVTNPFLQVTGVYNGLFTNTNGITEQTAGMLKGLSISQKGTYSGTLLINGASHGISGSFDVGGQATNYIPRKLAQGGPLVVEMTLLTSGNSAPQVTGVVSNEGEWGANLTAERAATSPASGQYTMLIHPTTSVALSRISPAGDGYALISESKDTAKITGALADGTAFSQSVSPSQNGDVPLYANLYHNAGLLLGWINLDTTNLTGTNLAWVHPGSQSPVFPNLFTVTNPVALSPWSNPSAAGILGNLTNLSILDTIYVTNKSVGVMISGNNLSGNAVIGTINPQTGQLKVTIGSGTGKKTGYGAVLLNQTNGGGYIVTHTNAQGILLQP